MILVGTLLSDDLVADDLDQQQSVQRWREMIVAQDPYPAFASPACPTCARPKAGGTLPESVDWSPYVPFFRDGHNQRVGRCGTFGTVGMMEVQYGINCCDQHGVPACDPLDRVSPCPAGASPCIYRADDDDPNGCWWEPGQTPGSPMQLDLSEQLLVSCNPSGYRCPDCAADGFEEFKFLIHVGTTTEELQPYRIPYQDFRTYAFWPPPFAQAGDPDLLYGTCALVNRGHPTHYAWHDAVFPLGVVDLEEVSDVPSATHLPSSPSYRHAPLFRLDPAGLGMDVCAHEYPPVEPDPWPPDCSLGLDIVEPAEISWALAQGYVLAGSMTWNLDFDIDASGNEWAHCRLPGCADGFDPDHPETCPSGHIVVVVGYEDYGNTLIIFNSHEDAGNNPIRIRRDEFGACGLASFEHNLGRLVVPIVHYDACPDPGHCDPRPDAYGFDTRLGLRRWMTDDFDADGLPNWRDVCLYDANPNAATAAGLFWDPREQDAWPDDPFPGALQGCDNCAGISAANRFDPDGDGFGSVCDGCDGGPPMLAPVVLSAANDGDGWDAGLGCTPLASPQGDGVLDVCDNCPSVLNEDQKDDDGDGVGDACDPCPGAVDFAEGVLGVDCDRIRATCDNCVSFFNPGQEDLDGDGLGDACDPCRSDPAISGEYSGEHDRTVTIWPRSADPDSDRFLDVACETAPRDNCPGVFNPGPYPTPQADSDADMVGDPCDRCPNDNRYGRWESDTDGDTIGDVCDRCVWDAQNPADDEIRDGDPPVNPWDDDGDLVGNRCDNCPRVANTAQQNYDWRWETEYAGLHSYFPGHGTETWGDACDPMPFAGRPPTPAEVRRSPVPVAGSTDPLLGYSAEAIRRPTVAAAGPHRSGLTSGETYDLPITASGFTVGGPSGLVPYPVDAGVMLRRCVCPEGMPLEECVGDGPDAHCPTSGDANWRPEFQTGWLAAQVAFRNADLGTAATGPYPCWSRADFATCEQSVDTRFEYRAGAGSSDVYPTSRTASWDWQHEVTPLDPADGAGGFVFWHRADPSGMASLPLFWELVAKTDTRCTSHGGSIDCDEYGNSFSTDMVEPRISYLPPYGAADEGGMGGPGPRIPDLGGGGDPLGALTRLEDVIGPFLRVVGRGDPLPAKFANYDPLAETQGLLYDDVSLLRGFHSGGSGVPSTVAANDPVPAVSDFAVAFFMRPIQQDLSTDLSDDSWTGRDPRGTMFLFGGILPDGTYSNELWRGDLARAETGAPSLVWNLERYSSWFPPGIIGAAVVPLDQGRRVAVLGGVAQLDPNPLAGGWLYDRDTGRWSRLPPTDSQEPRLAWSGVTWTGSTAYLYGGWDGTEFRQGLWRWNADEARLVRLDELGDATPGPRSQPSLTLSQDGRRLLLFGGTSPDGLRNDLWSYDFQARSWSNLAPQCAQGACPPGGRAAIYDEAGSDRVLLVPAGLDVQRQVSWLREGTRWVSASWFLGREEAEDCDANGTTEAELGWACRTSASWWAPVGERECDSASGSLVCSAPPATDAPVERISATPFARYEASDLPTLYVLDDRRLKIADISSPARPNWAPPVRLEGRGREVLLHRSALLVATTAGLEVFSLDDPLRPRRVLSWPASGGVDDLVPFGSKVLLVQPEAITTMDFGDPAAPRVLASNRVVRVLPGVWLLDPEWSWRDLIQRFLPGRRVAHFDGHRLLVGDRFDLAVFEVGGDGTISRLAGSLWRPRWVAGVRQVDGRGYTEDALGAGAVLGISDDGIAELGLHWLDGWVDRTLYRHDRVYRTGACGIEVALDE